MCINRPCVTFLFKTTGFLSDTDKVSSLLKAGPYSPQLNWNMGWTLYFLPHHKNKANWQNKNPLLSISHQKIYLSSWYTELKTKKKKSKYISIKSSCIVTYRIWKVQVLGFAFKNKFICRNKDIFKVCLLLLHFYFYIFHTASHGCRSIFICIFIFCHTIIRV